MNIERLQLQGALAEARKQYKNLETEASGLIILIRSLINPYIDLSEIEIEKAEASFKRFSKIIIELKNVKNKIKKLENDL